MEKLIEELQDIGAITIEKVPEIILMANTEYPLVDQWDFGIN
jgi:hypothetical protein